MSDVNSVLKCKILSYSEKLESLAQTSTTLVTFSSFDQNWYQ